MGILGAGLIRLTNEVIGDHLNNVYNSTRGDQRPFEINNLGQKKQETEAFTLCQGPAELC